MNNYWKNRNIIERTRLLDASINKCELALIKEYRRIEGQLANKIADLYYKIEAGGLQSADALYRYNEYWELLNNIQDKLTAMGVRENAIIEKKFIDLYKDNYTLIGKQLKKPTMLPNDETIKGIVNSVWVNDGKNWSNRIWTNQAKLATRLQESLTDAVVRGATPDELTKRVMHDFGASFNNASRLVRTEMSHVWTESAADKYRDAGVEYYEVLSEPDCCDECSEFNGEKYRIDDIDHLGPFHPFADALYYLFWNKQ